MAYRQIHTQMWKDDWYFELDPNEKLLFIYLFSNDNTNLIGLYKINLRIVAFETGLDRQMIEQYFDKFEKAGKVIYRDGYIWVVNLLRYNFNRSDRTYRAVKNALADIPDIPLKIQYIDAANRVLIRYGYSINRPMPETETESLTETETESALRASASAAAGDFCDWGEEPETAERHMSRMVERLTGYPITPNSAELKALETMVKIGTTEDDIRDALSFLGDNGKLARGPSSLLGSVKTAVAKRTQKANAKPSGKPYIPEEHASEVY